MQIADNNSGLTIGKCPGLNYDAPMQKTDIKKLMGANLARIRKERELTGEQLAAKVDSSASVISGAETGRSFGDDLLARLATALQIEPMEFFRPIRGHGLVAEQQEDFSRIDLPPGTFEYVVNDSAMFPRYYPGQTLFASRTEQVKGGDFVVVETASGLVMVRQVYFENDLIILQAFNPDLPPVVIPEIKVRKMSKVIMTKEG